MATPTLTKLTIATVNEHLFDGEVISVTVPGVEGYLTLLAHHEPYITLLRSGTITFVTPTNETKTVSINSGVLEASRNSITVLV
jgi:F-type H+-transporting ATPase subunit epsilon